MLRLGDSSLALGYDGITYAWDDLSGVARKMTFFRSGEFVRVKGVCIVYDGLGVKPDAEGINRLAGIFEAADGHRYNAE